MNPQTTIHDALTGITEIREMTNEEYAELLASGWTSDTPLEPTEP